MKLFSATYHLKGNVKDLAFFFVRFGEAGKDCGPRSRLWSRMIVGIFNNNSVTKTVQARHRPQRKKKSNKKVQKILAKVQAGLRQKFSVK